MTLSIYAPKAGEVIVTGDFQQTYGPIKLNKDDIGIWSTVVGPLAPDLYSYDFSVDGLKMIDPKNAMLKEGANGYSNLFEVSGEARITSYNVCYTKLLRIGLCDVLEVNPSETCTDYSFSSAGITIDGDPEDNLIVKAYHLLRSGYQFPPVDISLIKQIPFGAGLGGGSSDAAFMLKVV